MTERINVILADDHTIVREGLKHLIDAQPDMHVVGQAADGFGALDLAEQLPADVLVLDLSMPQAGGMEVARRLTHERPALRIVALTVHEESLYLTRMLREGAAAYVLKRSPAAELVRAIRAAAAGQRYVDPALSGVIVSGFLEREQQRRQDDDRVLSDREREVLIRIARGFSNKETAEALQISVKTVETYKARVSEKLGLRSRVDIVRYAAGRGWLGEAVAKS